MRLHSLLVFLFPESDPLRGIKFISFLISSEMGVKGLFLVLCFVKGYKMVSLKTKRVWYECVSTKIITRILFK